MQQLSGLYLSISQASCAKIASWAYCSYLKFEINE